MADEIKLYDVKHSYYCATRNFYSSEPHREYASWDSFMNDEGENPDDDYNFLFRWDWETLEEGDSIEGELVGDEPESGKTNQCLRLFYMGQRKGLFRVVTVCNVCEEDEPSIRVFLRARWEYMRGLWEPLSSEVTK